jgi:hypothetical protein
MKKLKDTQHDSIYLPGKKVTVSATLIPDDQHIVYEISAVMGSTTVAERHQLGGEGIGEQLDVISLQARVDLHRQRAADKAAWQENAKLIAAQID